MKITITTTLAANTPGYLEARKSLLHAVGIHATAEGITKTVPTVSGRTPVTIIARGPADRLALFLERLAASPVVSKWLD